MRLRNPWFELSSFLIGGFALFCAFGTLREYWDGEEPSALSAAIVGGVFLLVAIGCFGWSVWLGGLLKPIREWRLPESGERGETKLGKEA